MSADPRPVRRPLRLRRAEDGRLWATRGADSRPVSALRCFPWSLPVRHISLRDDDSEEVALVADLAELDPASREALEATLAEAGFVLEVERILDVAEEVEIRTWRVRTRQGARSFQTARDAWPRELPGGG